MCFHLVGHLIVKYKCRIGLIKTNDNFISFALLVPLKVTQRKRGSSVINALKFSTTLKMCDRQLKLMLLSSSHTMSIQLDMYAIVKNMPSETCDFWLTLHTITFSFQLMRLGVLLFFASSHQGVRTWNLSSSFSLVWDPLCFYCPTGPYCFYLFYPLFITWPFTILDTIGHSLHLLKGLVFLCRLLAWYLFCSV